MENITERFAEEIARLHDSGLEGDALIEAAQRLLEDYAGQVSGSVEVPADVSAIQG